MGWFWPTSSCPEISGQPAQKRILQPGDFRPGLPQTRPKHRRRVEIGSKLSPATEGISPWSPSGCAILRSHQGMVMFHPRAQFYAQQKRTALYRRGRNRILTNSTQVVILRTERALPVDGQPLRLLQEVTADCGDRLGGYFFLPLCTCKNRPQMPMITKQN